MKLSKPRHFASQSTFDRYILNAAIEALTRRQELNSQAIQTKLARKERTNENAQRGIELDREIQTAKKAIKKTYEDPHD